MPLLRPRRSDRPRHRHLRPRGGVHRPRARAAGRATCPTSRWCSNISPPPRRSQFVEARGRQCRRDDHPAAPPHQPQRDVRRRHSPARLLPAGRQARAHRLALRKAATSGSAKFFLGTDSAPHARARQGSGLRLRGHLQRALRARKLCRGVRRGRRARQVRGLRQRARPALLRPAAQRRHGDARTRADAQVPRSARRRRQRIVPFHAGETLGWRLA